MRRSTVDLERTVAVQNSAAEDGGGGRRRRREMKGAPAAAPAPQKRGGWRALPVLALVFLSMLVPLLFVLNQSGYLEDDRGPGARFETYELDERRNGNQSQIEQGDKGKHVAELIKQLEPNFQKDVVETLAKEADSGTGNIVSLASDPKNSSPNLKSKAVPPLESTSTIRSSSTTERVFHLSGTTDHVNAVSSDETEKSCQLEFGSYCIWRDKHREQMKDSMVKKLKDQLFVARAYYPSIAKIPAQDKLTRQMKMNIQEYERMLSEATTDADLPPDVQKKIERMESVIAKAKVFPVECGNVDKKLRQLLDLTEDEAHFHMKQSAFLYQLAVQTMPKSLHCLSMRLTVEYFRLHSADPELLQERDKHEEPSFHHYVIFSKHILAVSVVINSTVMHSKETDNLVFHVVTDSQNYVAMKYWFYRSNYKNATIDVLNFEDHNKTFDLSDKLQHFFPGEYTVSIRGRTDYISLYGSAHFLLPDMLPKLKRVIVLDDDVVVQRDLSSLWDLDMEGKVNGALEYCGLRLGQLKSQLGQDSFDSNACVWMSGLNVIDLEKWREHKLTESFLRFLEAQPHVADPGDSPDLPSDRLPEQGDIEGQTNKSLLTDLEDALAKQRSVCMSSLELNSLKEARLQSHIQHRISELEELPSSRGDDLQMKCLLELYGLKLVELQRKVRSDVCVEHWLRESCAYPDRKLYDWGLMRLRRPFMLYDMGDAIALESDDRLRKKRDAERLSRLEEEEKKRVETRKRKFFSELLDSAREFQLQAQTAFKRRKQRNDGVQAFHARQKQRKTRAEKLRIQALKADDEEAYMKMLEESKNERLTMLIGKTDELLVLLGNAVQRQKDAAHTEGIEGARASEGEETSVLKSEATSDSGAFDADSNGHAKTRDLLEGQRQYNSKIHSIQEKVIEQPSMLQGGELRSYQLEGLQWMLSLFNNNLNGILADEMGLGKTIQTIALVAYLMENKGVNGPHLIVAPKAVLPNWVNEFATWAPGIAAVLYDGTREERRSMKDFLSVEGNFNVLITHYDFIMRDKAFLKKIHWHYMIVDEGHRLKNHDCALSRTLVSGYRIRRRLLLTGTPIQNSLQELWSLLNFLLPSIFNSVENFEEWFNPPFADKSDVTLSDEEQLLIIRRLHHVIRPFLLRRKKDEVEKYLPGKTQVILKCDLSAWQKVYYQQVTTEGRVGLDYGTGKSKSLQNLSMQLRKCCNHPYLFVGGEHNVWNKEEIIRASGKFELLDRLLPKLQRGGHRVLLFSQMTRLIDILEIYLQLHNFKYLRLDGSTKTEERGVLLKKFNAKDSPFFMFLLSTRAGGLGLNLQTADTVIIFDSDWNPQMDQQAEDRAHRIGQTKEVRVFVLVSVGSIEEEILERAKQKMGIDAKVIQAGLFNTTSTAQDRRDMLQEIMRRGASSLGRDVPSEKEINRLAARSDEEFWLFEKMDEERRQRENYRSRLMEEHEVPDWAYPTHTTDSSKDNKNADHLNGQIDGKRKRKEVIYADSLSDVQWMKAVEGGQDLSKIMVKGKRREHNFAEVVNAEEQKPLQLVIENSERSESGSEDLMSQVAEKQKAEHLVSDKDEAEGGGSSWDGGIFTWKTHKRKRSSNHGGFQSSSDGKRSAF